MKPTYAELLDALRRILTNRDGQIVHRASIEHGLRILARASQ
jgi:hypothetical protein